MTDEALDGFYEALLDDDADALYERAPVGYLSTTPHGTIIKANETFLTWTGYRRGEVVGGREVGPAPDGGGGGFHQNPHAPAGGGAGWGGGGGRDNVYRARWR